jgi:hypothetical protein
MEMMMRIRRRNGNMVITVPMLAEPRSTNSGKSLLIASSLGVRKSRLKVDGRNILYTANAFIKKESHHGSRKRSAKPKGGRPEKR